MSCKDPKVLLACMALVVAGPAARAGNWSEPVEVRHDEQRCVTYRARLNGDFLIVQATHEAGWHTNAMDNQKRAEEKLAGRQALGVDSPTEIRLSQGLELAGPWYQSPPKDASKPELLWFTWVFEKEALFVAKVRRSGPGPAVIGIRGQACTDSACKKIDIALSLPLAGAAEQAAEPIDWKALIPVR